MALPEDWPYLAKLREKHSWDYTNTIEPSVQKATSHLDLLQTIIDEWHSERQQRMSNQHPSNGKSPQKEPVSSGNYIT